MVLIRFRTAAILLAAAIGASACSYDDGYGYGGLSVGYGGGYGGGYYDPYDDYGYGDGGYGYGDYGYGYGSGFGSPYWGWYGDFYYPGTGIYVYDRYRRPHRWNDYQRRYWSDRRDHWHGRDRDGVRDNWRDFPRGQGGGQGNWQRGDGQGGNRGNWQGNRGNDGATGSADTQQGNRGNWQGYRRNDGTTGSANQQGWQNRGQWRQQQSVTGQGTVQTAPQYRSGGNAGRSGGRRGR